VSVRAPSHLCGKLVKYCSWAAIGCGKLLDNVIVRGALELARVTFGISSGTEDQKETRFVSR